MSRSVYFTMMLCFTIGLGEGRKVMNGRYTRDISEFELLVPHKVDRSGTFLSFHLPHFFHHNFAAHRLKRDFNHHEAVHYKLHFDGSDHVVELLPNHGFISPSFVRETHFKDSGRTLRGRRMDSKPPLMCHYTGQVQGIDGSRAALSTCDGLTGYFETASGKYLIEAVDGHGANEDGHLLHVIHKIETPTDDFCGTTQWEKGWNASIRYHHQPHLRAKRSEVKHRFMQVMVVADKTFLNHHKNDDPERYILTVMNMVSDFFHDSSTGQIIDVVIVRIVRLEEEKPMELEISKNATQTLTSFCKWQNEQNPKDDRSQHHDTALLLTRRDICTDESCHLLGLANVATICVPEDSCAINEDNGLMLGVTITHEIGHLMGCDHDDGKECKAKDEHNMNTVMAPQVKLATGQWSKCSKRFIQELIDDKLGECMNDEPIERAYKFDESLLPGTIYDADFQCRMLFGENVKVCQWNVETICERLICQIGDKCRTNGEQAADGTSCGSNKWCIKKECVRVGKRRDEAIAGGWSEWGEWSTCNRQCGSGIQYSARDCTNPTPKNGGRYCLGERKRYQICNIKPCAHRSPSFRQQQCEAFKDKKHQWTSHFKASESCALFCINQKNVIHRMSPRVKDGTPCKPGANDMCIAAECKNVGCDWVLNSHKIDDRCGLCNGNGTSCTIVNGTLEVDDEDSKKSASIPSNARNIAIRKLAPSVSRIQLTNPSTKTNYLKVYDAGELDLNDEIALLELPETGREEVFIRGPTSKELKLHVDYKKGNPVKVFYQFSSPNEVVATELKQPSEKVGGFMWDFLVPDGKCDVRCGGGIQQIPAVCVSMDGEQPDDLCELPKPPSRTKLCNTHPCTNKWQIGKWSACSECQHKAGQQERTIWCGQESRRWDEKPLRVDDDKCSDSDGLKPPIKRLCSAECTRKCNGNRSTRAAHDFVELFKNFNVFVLQPEIFVATDHATAKDELTSKCEDEASPDEEKLLVNNDDSKTKQMFIVNPMLIRRTSKHRRKLRELQRNPRKSNKGKVALDKSPASGKFLEIPVVKGKHHLSDDAFRKLGDKLERTLDVKHARIIQAAEPLKATAKAV